MIFKNIIKCNLFRLAFLLVFFELITNYQLVYPELFLESYNVARQDIHPYRSPTLRQLDYENIQNVKSNLANQGISLKFWNFWNQIVYQEDRGVFGYHAAKQKMRIFQDIIKIIFEEILEIEIKRDFHFFRIPLDPLLREYNDLKEFLLEFPFINDGEPIQRDQILSLNYTLFGNHKNFSQCTVCYFSKNHSWFTISYVDKLRFLFTELGIPASEISGLFEIGREIEDFQTGVIYQFFDSSYQEPNHYSAYELVDVFSYPSLPAGSYDHAVSASLSDIFQGVHKRRFDLNEGQIRLIMNTMVTMNPYSPISMRRYDLIPLDIIKKYENSLRSKIRSLPREQKKVSQFKNQLKVFWNET